MALAVGENIKVGTYEIVDADGKKSSVDILGSYLGEFEGRDWYMDPKTGTLYWRVPDIRECIAAPPGFQVLSADYSQIEVKLMAFLSGDPVLTAAINSRKDIHCYTATEVYGKRLNFTYEDMWEATQGPNAKKHPRNKELKKLRSAIKTVTFGVPYGATAKRVASMVNNTPNPTPEMVAEAQAFIDEFFAKFSVLAAWLEGQGNQALSWGFTATPKGRRRFYVMPPEDDPDKDGMYAQIRRWAGNHPIQAANADMLKLALRKIYERIRGGVVTNPKLYDAWLSIVVHDEIVMLCRKEHVPAVEKIMHESMTEAYEEIIDNGLYNEIVVVADEIWEKV